MFIGQEMDKYKTIEDLDAFLITPDETVKYFKKTTLNDPFPVDI